MLRAGVREIVLEDGLLENMALIARAPAGSVQLLSEKETIRLLWGQRVRGTWRPLAMNAL